MDCKTMAKYGNGGADKQYPNWLWRVKGENIKIRTSDLGKWAGMPNLQNHEALPIWNRYREWERSRRQGMKPCDQHLSTLLLEMDAGQGKDTLKALRCQIEAILGREMAQSNDKASFPVPTFSNETLVAADKWDIDHNDLPKLAGYEIGLTKEIPAERLRSEIDIYLEQIKARPKGYVNEVKLSLNLFAEITGDVSFRDLSIDHWRKLYKRLDDEGWSPRTKYNRQRHVEIFLERLENSYDGVRFIFLRNDLYQRQQPDGQRTTWTLEQVAIAWIHATGTARLALMAGLNCGMYRGDIHTLAECHVHGDHIQKKRAKEEWKTSPMVGNWKMWAETKEVLQYELPYSKIDDGFKELRDKWELPEQSDLRKTVAQWLDDANMEQASRNYRCERPEGNHGKYYTRFTPPQVESLDAALDFVRNKILTAVQSLKLAA